MIPGPRPSKGLDRPAGTRDRGRAAHRPPRSGLHAERGTGASPPSDRTASAARPDRQGTGPFPVALTRTPQGWQVVSPHGVEPVADLVEGLSLADLVAEQYGVAPDPDRGARRSARGGAGTADAEDAEPVDARVAALERTVAQLEHALAARVAIERAIGVLVERHRTNTRDAFEALRGRARSEGRAVHDLAREVLEGLDDRAVVEAAARAVLGGCPSAAAHGATDPASRRAERSAQLPAGADGRS